MTGSVVPAEVVRRLYAVPPARFVAARTEAVSAARGSEPDTARAIGKLRKPTVAAWLVNLLALRRADLLDGLVELSGQLRAAQRDLRGPALRELSTRRRALVDGLVAECRELAVAEDPALASTKLPLGEVEATLSAALADEEIAAQVRSGRLVRAVDYAGFGEVPRPRLRLVGPDDGVAAADEPTRVAEPARAADKAARAADKAARAADKAARARAARRQRLVDELDKAEAGQRAARTELDRAVAAEQDAADAVAEAQRQLAEWERRRSAAEREHARRKVARKTAERAAVAARRYAGDVAAALEDLPGPQTDR
ncbi:hypothetical protein O7543_14715 [Solwaraspora sp. WMMA2080]|uniref:hypothetical protein n=1 Tax=unclassified Solwaraspora TaxID=2627926 RepID=UPI00248B9F3F|nr:MULTISPECIES: hypothetical protein [unclassified Solwaraspora]WBB97882.1 hypothetical protein O7553_02635 [Solwaraspora sp. WMMA2059]WBC23559.1 hypothetical protein O7543_14715 [Solwaraspora sp. WMMA2080]